MGIENKSATVLTLDKGHVRLVDRMGGDLSIVRAARVSYDEDWREHGDKNDHKLIDYLWKNKHTSPFEACTLTFEIKAPIFVLRQWHRHRTQSYNEISARYVQLDEGFYEPDPYIVGSQSKSTKQARVIDHRADVVAREAVSIMKEHNLKAFAIYKKLLDMEIPRELARSVLPVAAYSRMFTTMNLLNFFRFAELRLDPHAQYEIRQYAKAMLTLVKVYVAPVATRAFEDSLNAKVAQEV